MLDNYRASNLVNDKKLLVPSSFVKSTSDEYVEAGTSRIPILGRGKRLLSKVLEGLDGAGTTDLVLNDVTIIEGFYVNIISKARLLEAGLWIYGYDCTLRYGTDKESVVVRKLTRMYNLVFFEYKPLSPYLSILSVIPTSSRRIVMFLTIKRRLRKRF